MACHLLHQLSNDDVHDRPMKTWLEYICRELTTCNMTDINFLDQTIWSAGVRRFLVLPITASVTLAVPKIPKLDDDDDDDKPKPELNGGNSSSQ